MPKRTVDLDQYFTSQALVAQCIEALQEVVRLDQFDLILEPSAGSGRFLDALPVDGTLGIDICPSDPRVQKADFFQWQPAESKKVLVLGNPPFGQRGALAIRFLNHAMTFAHTVALILPRSFNKFTFQNRVDRQYQLAYSQNLDGQFDFREDVVSVQTVFQVWQRSDTLRDLLKPAKSHPHFLMKHAHLSRVSESEKQDLVKFADFAIPQVGAKFHPTDPKTITKGSYWFIRLESGAIRLAFDHLDFAFLEGTNTAHTSLSKADIVQAYVDACESLGADAAALSGSEVQLGLFWGERSQ